MSTNLQQDYAFNQSAGAVTLPVNASYIEAYAIYLGITEPLNNSWIQAICNHFGITEPLYGSYLIALANYYGITEPVNGSWWYALSQATPIPTELIWNLVSTEWQNETTEWATGTAPLAPTFDQEGQLLTESTPTLTGTADANNTILLTINSNIYIGIANGLGVWSIDVTDTLPGAPGAGQNYSVDITAKDTTNGLETSIVGSVNILTTSAVLTFEMGSTWSVWWYYHNIMLEQETSPGVWEAIEYDGNPTQDNGTKFYKTYSKYCNTNICTPALLPYLMNIQSGDDEYSPAVLQQTDIVPRTMTVDAGYTYRIKQVSGGESFGKYNYYTVYKDGIELLPLYQQTVDSPYWGNDYIQQTFTL